MENHNGLPTYGNAFSFWEKNVHLREKMFNLHDILSSKTQWTYYLIH